MGGRRFTPRPHAPLLGMSVCPWGVCLSLGCLSLDWGAQLCCWVPISRCLRPWVTPNALQWPLGAAKFGVLLALAVGGVAVAHLVSLCMGGGTKGPSAWPGWHLCPLSW